MKKFVVAGLGFLALIACKDETFHQLLDTTKFHESNQTTMFVGKWKQVLSTDDKGVWIAETSDKLYDLSVRYDGEPIDSYGYVNLCGLAETTFELGGKSYSVESQESTAINPYCQTEWFIVPDVIISLPAKDTLMETRISPVGTITTTQTKYIRVN